MTRFRHALTASTLFTVSLTLVFLPPAAAQARVASAQTVVTRGQGAVRFSSLRNQGGLGTFLDVLNALAQLVWTWMSLLSIEFLYQMGLAQHVRATGGC